MELIERGSRGPEVRRVQRVLTLSGDLDGAVDGVFGPETEEAVRTFQRSHDLVEDGVVGPRTAARLDEVMRDAEEPWRVLRHARRERDAAEADLDAPPGAPLLDGEIDADGGDGDAPPLGRDVVDAVLGRAREEWERPVHEPHGDGWERIDDYIRGDEGLGWEWEDRYVRNRQFAWCGAFAAHCYAAAGLDAEVRRRHLASCYRLHEWAKGTPRLLPPEAAQPGDIIIVGPAGGKRWGAHITLCEGVDRGGAIATIEGNASGTGPDGERYEGVVRQRRPFAQDADAPSAYRAVHVIRPLPGDFS